jgi:hypothetical protein
VATGSVSSWRLPIGALMAPGFTLAGIGVIAADRSAAGLTPAVANAAPLAVGIIWSALAWWGPRLIGALTLARLARLANLAGGAGSVGLAWGSWPGYVLAVLGLALWSGVGVLVTPVYIQRLAGSAAHQVRWLQWVNAISIATAMATPPLLGAAIEAGRLPETTFAVVAIVALISWPDRSIAASPQLSRKTWFTIGWVLVVAVVGLEMVVTFWAASWMVARGFGSTPADVGWAVSAYFAGMLAARMVVPLAIRHREPRPGIMYGFLLLYGVSLLGVAGGNLTVATIGLFLTGVGVGPLYPLCIHQLLASIDNPVAASATGLAASASAVGGGPGILGALAAIAGIGPATVAIIPLLAVFTVVIVKRTGELTAGSLQGS